MRYQMSVSVLSLAVMNFRSATRRASTSSLVAVCGEAHAGEGLAMAVLGDGAALLAEDGWEGAAGGAVTFVDALAFPRDRLLLAPPEEKPQPTMRFSISLQCLHRPNHGTNLELF